MTAGEAVVISGGGAQGSTSSRWGDYSAMSVDPVDDCTFWYTSEYYAQTSPAGWRTRIAAFRFPSCLAERGSLSGSVSSMEGGAVSGAQLTAVSGSKSYFTTSGPDGAYSFSNLPSGLYSLTIETYGFLSQSLSGIQVEPGVTTTRDVVLTPAARVLFSGVVRDGSTGWPLYARIDIDGYPGSPIWAGPVHGDYALELAAGRSYTATVSAWVDGYSGYTLNLPALSAPVVQAINLQPERGACTAPGYTPASLVYSQDFETGNGDYTSQGTANEWAWGTPTTWPGSCGSGGKCWGTDLSGNYQPSSDQSLLSPAISLAAYPPGTSLGLRWKQAWAIESAIYDQAYAELSIDSGPWQTLWSHQGPSIQMGWTEMIADVSAAAGKSLRLRWRLVSDEGVEFAGLYVDQVRITAGCSTPAGALVVGQVNTEDGEPLPGAIVKAAAGGEARTRVTPQDPQVGDAFYTVFAAAGENAVTVSGAYGYASQTQPLDAPQGETVEQNFTLPSAQVYSVSGFVRDAATGWPLYARLQIDGYPDSPVWSDPYTGWYQVDLPGDMDYTLRVTAWLPGYLPETIPLAPLVGPVEQDVSLLPDLDNCAAPGYQAVNGVAQTFSSGALPLGWTIVNQGSSPEWRFDDPGERGNLTGGSGGFAAADSDFAGRVSMDTQLRTPVLDLSQADQVMLSFRTHFKYNGTEIADVDVSVNGAAGPWVNVWRQSGANYPDSPTIEQVDITALAARQPQVMVRFHYYGAFYAWWWQVDEVQIGVPECLTPEGGLVAGSVDDANTGLGLLGAEIRSPTALAAVAQAGPQPDITTSFYWFYAPVGEQSYTASLDGGYGTDSHTVEVVSGGLTRQDFALPAGFLRFPSEGVNASLEIGQREVFSLTLANDGDVPALYTLETSSRELPLAGPIQQPAFVVKPFKQDYRATAPPEAAALPPAPQYPGGEVIRSWELPEELQGWGIAFGQDQKLWVSSPGPTWGGSDSLAEFEPNGIPTRRRLPHHLPHTFGPADLAYEWDLGRVWVMNVNSEGANCIYAVDPNNGYTGERICPGGEGGFAASQRGLAYDPAGQTWFAAGWNDGMLYRFSRQGEILAAVSTGLPISGLAYNPTSGRLFALVSSTEARIYVLDVRRGYTTLGQFVIPGFSPQGGAGLEMDCTGALWALDQSANRVFQVGTGETSKVCDASPAWLALDPDSGELPALSSQTIQVEIDTQAPGLGQPGQYLAQVTALSDTPYQPVQAPVTLTLTAPDSWGVVQGTITSLGLCDASPTALEGAAIRAESASGFQIAVETSSTGAYDLWLDSLLSPYTITVSAEGHVPLTGQLVEVNPGSVTPLDADLRTAQPCLAASVESLEAALDLRHTQAMTFSLQNTGAAAAEFQITTGASWLSVAPMQGVIPSGASSILTAVFDANQAAAAGVYTTTLVAAAGEMSLHLPVTLTVAAPYGFTLLPHSQEAYGPAGSTITYTLRLVNTGTEADSYRLSLSGGSGWTASLPQAMVDVPSGLEREIQVLVQVPPGTPLGAVRIFTLRVESAADPLWWAETVLKGVSGTPPLFLLLAPSP
jgi:hypothetical protein